MTPARNPRVLIVNDDGIDAPGIVLLEEIARQFTDDIWVVAPDEERSGAGHSLSMSHPIRMRQRDERHFAVKGTPTDCALLGIHELMTDRKPDLLLSGINRGPNLAEDITYSGTASAAIEGVMLGIPSVALSQIIRYKSEVHWDTARAYAPLVIRRLLDMRWRPGAFVNVNFPDCPPDAVKGIRVTRQGMRPTGAFMPVRRVDERHVPYYWIKAVFPDGGHEPGNDLQAALDHEVSITPLQVEMTAHALVPELESLFDEGH
ncbi:MAG: 5'/3'-nucleotidase SurE [Gammaproteobacteria bacterium]|nr:5'/3'-nucleotidase SurE [Gammaproteobacteria bacterium]